MAMVSVVNWQPTSGLMVQADRLRPEVSSHLMLCCIQYMNRVNSHKCFKHDDSAIKIILVLLLLHWYRNTAGQGDRATITDYLLTDKHVIT